mmetsp:Transcript_11891/g.19357  ORF Transcript_11891/g.19357 Transcript_11891/m.19357 type:complete len:169 (+) Transcript_11891:95-601(+)|eukprot:CAMPEP_0203785388 /NCGR_PEP_ID=MMETSP0100_2-20121128/1001_1 /ASSEMBLY_ACC=CAM_ASM_000210 /TAXON_ID=96639 /ORGANISM=" , Strain NY0313808BC1" /LENGTH=168 /DNA_ID=CAMNT_0050687489 /DNA_START=73 /DNA_END=579 /DNA_ORIENTATION=-
MTKFGTANDFWDTASRGDLKRLQRHIRSRVVIRKPQALAGIDEYCPWSGYTALHFAAGNGHFEAVRMLLEFGANVNSTTRKTKKTALHIACENGYAKIAALLLDCHDSVDELVQDERGRTALMYACECGKLRLVKLFFKHFPKLLLRDLVEPGYYSEEIDDYLEDAFK